MTKKTVKDESIEEKRDYETPVMEPLDAMSASAQTTTCTGGSGATSRCIAGGGQF